MILGGENGRALRTGHNWYRQTAPDEGDQSVSSKVVARTSSYPKSQRQPLRTDERASNVESIP
jgi:hypothetical protein